MVIEGPRSACRQSGRGGGAWRGLLSAAAFRELDDALLRLRFNYPEIGLVLLKSAGNLDRVAEFDDAMLASGAATGSSTRCSC